MRILVATTHPDGRNVAYDKFRQLLAAPVPGRDDSAWCLDADQADAVLFVDDDYIGPQNFVPRLLRHPLARRFRGRSYRYSNTDWPAPYIPGIFPSLTQQTHVRGRSCSSHYLSTEIPAIPLQYIEQPEREWLFSFVGRAATSRVRQRVLQLQHPRAWIGNTLEAPHHENKSADYRSRYWSLVSRSQFVICPRGYGSSSMRLFETLQCGRVPVIVSDQWIPPPGPDWPALSVRVAERDVPRIPQILEALEPEAAAMGQRARAAWLRWFSDEQTPATFLNYLQGFMDGHQGWSAVASDAAWSLRFLVAQRQLRWLVHPYVERVRAAVRKK